MKTEVRKLLVLRTMTGWDSRSYHALFLVGCVTSCYLLDDKELKIGIIGDHSVHFLCIGDLRDLSRVNPKTRLRAAGRLV